MASSSRIQRQSIRNLANARSLRPMQEGEVIFRAGEPGDCLYGVVDGRVKVAWDDGLLYETIEAGSSFGVGALVDGNHRRYGTATALSDGHLLVRHRERFQPALQEQPMFPMEMLQDLDERYRGLKARTHALEVDATGA
ncbi:MAG: hypothetical protein ER33_00810 [Cyanobium sp. CACIAM 14]|nr:MAG: hypothetical protein ER33_00810 [Cyanobium sp. CACIAM 14]